MYPMNISPLFLLFHTSFFLFHRATCGLSLRYHTSGFNKWRDPIKPAATLQRLCKDYKLSGPHFQPGKCRIEQVENRVISCCYMSFVLSTGLRTIALSTHLLYNSTKFSLSTKRSRISGLMSLLSAYE